MWLMDLKNFPTTRFYLSKGPETLDSSWIYEFHKVFGRKTNKPIQVSFVWVCVLFRYLPSNSPVVENLGTCTLFKLVHENLVLMLKYLFRMLRILQCNFPTWYFHFVYWFWTADIQLWVIVRKLPNLSIRQSDQRLTPSFITWIKLKLNFRICKCTFFL